MATARRIRITCPSDLDILTDAMGKITITVTPRTDATTTDVDPSKELLRGRCNAPTKKPGRPGCLNREGKCEHRAHALWREANGLKHPPLSPCPLTRHKLRSRCVRCKAGEH